MASIKEIEHKLSVFFTERLKKQFDQKTYEQLLRNFDTERRTILRINTLKTDIQKVLEILRNERIQFERISFLPNSLVLKNAREKEIEKLSLYENGEVYFQGISSQLPVLFLDPQANETILDVSAAPGSKTTQIAIQMQNKGKILANEIDQIRYERLKYNIEKQGTSIVETRLGDGVALGHEFAETFDRVLLDAPCSAEGRIEIKDFRSYRFWSEKNIKQNAQLQKRLFLSAYQALKRNGVLVYSTCTLAPEENEKIVDWALERFPDLQIQKIELDFKHLLPILSNFENTTFKKEVKYAIKASPSEISEGFFIAKFVKL